MSQQLPRPIPCSPPSAKQYTIRDLISIDPILLEYFKNNSSMGREWKLAQQLMLDGIRYRANTDTKGEVNVRSERQIKEAKGGLTSRGFDKNVENDQEATRNQLIKQPSNTKAKHHNVAYVKHNRFLSPKQKNQLVTPKVTQVIPVKSSPVVIYGKPRVKVDNQCGCPYHTNQQECLMSIPYGGPCQPKTPRQLKNTRYEVHVAERDNPNFAGLSNNPPRNYEAHVNQGQVQQPVNELSRYKSVPNLKPASMQPQNNRQLQKTRKNGDKITKKADDNKKSNTVTANNQQYGNVVYVNKIIQVQTRMPGRMRVVKSPSTKTALHTDQYSQKDSYDQILSPKNHTVTRTKVKQQPQSKIKQLIQRDKKSKAMQKNMKKQQQRIKTLELMLNSGQQPKKAKFYSPSPDSSPSSEEMSMMDSQIVQNYKKTITKNTRDNRESVSLARFGGKDEVNAHGHHLECDCSKTFLEFEESDVANQSSFSEFDH